MKKGSVLVLCILLSVFLGLLPAGAELILPTAVVDPGTQIQPYEASTSFIDGQYYMNSAVTETFLKRASTTSLGMDRYAANNANFKWIIENQTDGTVVLRSAYQSNYLLYGAGEAVRLGAVSETATIASNFKWRTYMATGGGVLFLNVGYNKVLYYDGSQLSLATRPTSSDSDYSNAVWRTPSVSLYVNLMSFTISYGTAPKAIGQTVNCTITATPSNATWRHGANYLWESSDTDVATVSSSGMITAVGAGTAWITATHKATGAVAETSVTVDETKLNGGIYAICLFSESYDNLVADQEKMNKLLWGDGSDSPEFLYSLGFDEDDWRLILYSDGNYRIQSMNNTSTYLAIDGGALVFESFSSSDTSQLWSITKNETGSTALGRYLITNVGTNQYLGCENLGQILVPEPSSTAVEWSIIGDLDVAILSAPEEFYNRSSFFDDAAQQMRLMGYTNIYHNRDFADYGVSREELFAYMRKAEIVFIRGHGQKTNVMSSDGYLTKEFLEAAESDSFANTELIVYATCSTAEGGEYADNMVNATLDLGVSSVIGFEDEILTESANDWAELFFEYLRKYSTQSGKTLRSVCDQAYLDMTAQDRSKLIFSKVLAVKY